MKANTPERLYLSETIYSTYLYQVPDPDDESAVEYIRTDAFIKKAVSYLNSKLYDWVQTTNPNQRSYANTIMKQDFIEDFRNYMKGE
jgi:hypothetical protein